MVGKGYWESGLAISGSCKGLDISPDKPTENEKSEDSSAADGKEQTPESEKGKETAELTKMPAKDKNEMRSLNDPTQGYFIDINIQGDVQKQIDDQDGNYFGKAVAFWDGFKRQIFREPINDVRKITFKLIYKGSGRELFLASRTYPYNPKFISYFEIPNFSKMLAFDLLVEAPFQWDLTRLKQKKDNLRNKNNQKQVEKDKSGLSILISSAIVDIEMNQHFQFVQPFFIGKSTQYLGMSDGIIPEKTTNLNTNVLKRNIFDTYIFFADDLLPERKDGVFLALGDESYTKYYT